MKKIKKFFKNSRFLSKILAMLAGALAGFAIASWLGLVIGVVIGYFFETLLAKSIKTAKVSK